MLCVLGQAVLRRLLLHWRVLGLAGARDCMFRPNPSPPTHPTDPSAESSFYPNPQAAYCIETDAAPSPRLLPSAPCNRLLLRWRDLGRPCSADQLADQVVYGRHDQRAGAAHQGKAGQAQHGAGAGRSTRGALQHYQCGQQATAFQAQPNSTWARAAVCRCELHSTKALLRAAMGEPRTACAPAAKQACATREHPQVLQPAGAP